MAKPLSRRLLARYIAAELTKEGAAPQDAISQLAAYLIVHKKTNEVDVILRDVARQLADAGHVEAVVTAARELSGATEKRIKELVASQTGAQAVVLDVQLDPEVIGGVKIATPGRELNATIAHQLHLLKTRYRKA